VRVEIERMQVDISKAVFIFFLGDSGLRRKGLAWAGRGTLLATIFLVSRRIRCFFQKLPASCCRYCTRGLDGRLSCGEDLDAFGIVGAQRNFVPLSALHHGDARLRRQASTKQVTLSHCGRRPLTANHRAALLQRTEDRKGMGPSGHCTNNCRALTAGWSTAR
jgi:hypothetical protein